MEIRHKYRAIAFSVLIISIFLISAQTFGQVTDESEIQVFKSLSLYEKKTLETSYLEYNGKVWDLDRELISVKSHREWVNLQIERLRFKNKPIPEDMNEALNTLDEKIDAIEREKATLEMLMDKNIKRLSELEWEVKNFSKKIGESPDWFIINPKIEKKMQPVVKGGGESVQLITDMLAKSPKWPEIQKWVEITSEDEGVFLRNSLPILFGSGKASVPNDYVPFLNNLAVLLKPLDVEIVVEGFTDSQPLKGNKSFRSNYELAATRAANVAGVLMNAGFPSERIRIISHGGEKTPKAEKPTVNRRVSISVNLTENKGLIKKDNS